MKKIKVLAAILSAVMCISALGTLGASAVEYDAAYDVNGDSKNDTKDLTRLMKFISGQAIFMAVTDVNRDGTIDTKDLTRLMKFLAGVDLEFDVAYTKLTRWLSQNGSYEDGVYIVYVSESVDENGTTRLVSLGYEPEANGLAFGFIYASADESSAEYGIIKVISSALMYNDPDNLVYMYMDMDLINSVVKGVALGETSAASFGLGTTLEPTEADLGDLNSAAVMSYTSVNLYYSLLDIDAYLTEQQVGVSLADIGFDSLFPDE